VTFGKKNQKGENMKAIEPLMILILVFICTGFPFNSIANEIDDGNIDFSKKSYNLATAHYLKYLSKSPDSDGYIAYRIGLCYYLSGNQEKAVMYFKSAKEKNPNV
jgi:tetratricopeptide (TPR) repeat protein